MTVIKKWTAVKIIEETINDDVVAKLKYGTIEYSYGHKDSPTTDFLTECDAIEYAYNQDKYGNWLITQITSFDNF